MRKKMSFKRTVSLLLALILSVSSLAIPAFAETATMTDLTEITSVSSGYDSAELVMDAQDDEQSLVPKEGEEQEDEAVHEPDITLPEGELPVYSEPELPEDDPVQEAPDEPILDEEAPDEDDEPVIDDEPEVDIDIPADAPIDEAEDVDPDDDAFIVQDEKTALQAAIDQHGRAYVFTEKNAHVYGRARCSDEDLIYTAADDHFIVVATEYNEFGVYKVWFLDQDDEVLSGYVSELELMEEDLADDELIYYIDHGFFAADIMTAAGLLTLFRMDGTVPAAEEAPDSDPTDAEPELPAAGIGSYLNVTTDTRVFANVDEYAMEDFFSDEFVGCFVKNAVVKVVDVQRDSFDNLWYQVQYKYGDDFKDGTMKWTDYDTVYVLACETSISDKDACTVTDYAYSLEIVNMLKKQSRMFTTTAMDGFTLKNISVSIGGFYAWQSGLYGSSGRDSDYPQIAKSAAHGNIYATPHYLEGFSVYCLEHNLSGPGEGSGSSQTAKGPYVLVDMDYFVNNPDAGGVSGVRYKASTMHALGWVLRHTYPFMALNRSDSNNNTWSRVAGQFAMREVIKQLEGAQYVRSYWDMDNFYAFSGGAPAVYLTYARWLATNGIARARITGRITASNQSLSVSGSNYIGTVTLTTDADLIRIPKTVGTLTGNTGGSDASYYYLKSGDTIRVTSTQSRFSISMESISSADEEADFLVGVPSVGIQKVLVPIYGTPYPLQSANVTFELSLGEISVTKKSSDGILLPGTVFELLNSSGTVVATATTDSKGVAVFASLQPGSYKVREKTAPQGYQLSITTTQDVSVVAGVTATASFTNERIMGRIRVVKTDSITGKPLAGVVFTVTRLSGPAADNPSDIGKVVATITTNAEGVAETGLLPWGQYRIDETGVLNGYIDSGFTTTVWIK